MMKARKRKYISMVLLTFSLVLVVYFVFDLYLDLKLAQQIEKEKAIDFDNTALLKIDLADFQKEKETFLVIDVREHEEFGQGRLKGSENIRLGDLLSDEKIKEEIVEKQDGKKLMFFCHDGVRSKMAAELFSQDQDNIFITEDAFDQLRGDAELKQNIWEGTTAQVLPGDFWKDLKNRGYRAKKIETELVVDVSTESKNLSAIAPNSTIMHFPMMIMATTDVQQGIEQIGTSTFTVVCDDKASCFFAKLLAYRVEQRGGRFVGYFYWGRDN